jgi:hypothetical protein
MLIKCGPKHQAPVSRLKVSSVHRRTALKRKPAQHVPWDSLALILLRGSQSDHRMPLLETISGEGGFSLSMQNKIVLNLFFTVGPCE